jgi:isopenicillin-N N-acyltransferase-like protein
VSTDLPLPLIAVRGTPSECGVAYGRQAADLVAANIEAYLDRFATRARLDQTTVRRAGTAFRDATRAYQPRIAAMLDGVAAGADVLVEELYAVNGRTELLSGALRSECTSVGVLDSRTAGGHTLLAQNWDWHPAQRPYTVLLATRDERGFAVITLAEAGMVAKAGLNSAGVGLCVNLLGSDRDGRPGGVPYHVLLRGALEADCLSLALRAVCTMPRSASVNLMLGQAGPQYEDGAPVGISGGTSGGGSAGVPEAASGGASSGASGGVSSAGWTGGEVVDVELVPGAVGVLNPVDGLLTHANHLVSGVPARDTYADRGGSSYFRGARVARLLATPKSPTPGTTAVAGLISESAIAAALADPLRQPHAICRHADPRDGDDDLSETLYSVIMDLDDRRLSVAAGPPCAHPYVDVVLDKVV